MPVNIFMEKPKLMEITVYIQCDARFNGFLLASINKKKIIEHTINQVKKIGMYPIVTSIYECSENAKLIDCLRQMDNVEVILSNEENVTKRFINTIINKSGYIVRVGGDQVLLDYDMTKKILENIEGYDFYYEDSLNNCVLPDIVAVNLLKRKYHEIITADRYFHPLLNAKDVKRLNIETPLVFHNCRANNYLGYMFAKQIIENKIDVYKLAKNLIYKLNSNNSNFYSNGILTSWILGDSAKDFFYDIDGNVNPWWCEAAVNLTKDKIKNLKGLRVFEWGAGNSTLFWAKYASEVISIEYNQLWYHKMNSILPENAIIKYFELEYNGKYCKSINETDGLFDIILIDGRDRVRCVKNCINKLKHNGIIIWDNSERNYYKEGYQYLKEQGFKQLELSGSIWGLPEIKDYTSFFYKNDNIFDL